MTQRKSAVLAGLCALAIISSAGCAASAAQAADANKLDACLPFTMPDAGVLFKSPKKVFAHYFYPFPLSINNKPSETDYYNANFLSKTGESNKWTAQGGFLRQRPLGVPTQSAANWPVLNMETEIRMAIARGITGFTIDMMSAKDAPDPKGYMQGLLTAAQAVDPRFKIVVMPDIAALKSDSGAVIAIIAAAASSPAAYRLDDGRLVVSAFNASGNSVQWWTDVIAQLKSRGINIAFVPTFLGWSGNAAAFASISHGFSDWGTATASVSDKMKGDSQLAHSNYNKLFMMPVDPQQYRPKDGIYWEAGNSSAFRNAWTSAIDGQSEWVQLVTWSDFSESSQMEPYTDATLRRDIGTGFYDMNGYYATWFLTGVQPTITHDVLYYFYRREPTNAASPAQTAPNKAVSSSAEDNIEVVAFLTSPGVISINIGGKNMTQNASSGITSFKVPTAPGTPVFSLSRNGSEVFSYQGPLQIYGQAGIPSGVIDMTYWSGSGSKKGVCSL